MEMVVEYLRGRLASLKQRAQRNNTYLSELVEQTTVGEDQARLLDREIIETEKAIAALATAKAA